MLTIAGATDPCPDDTQDRSGSVAEPHIIVSSTTPTKGSVGSNVAVDSTGRIFALLRLYPGDPKGREELALSTSPEGGIWTTGALGVGATDDATIAIGPEDDIHVVYAQAGRIYYMAKATGFSSPIALSSAVSGVTAASPQVSVDLLGRVHVAWHVETPRDRLVKYRRYSGPIVGWLPTRTLSDTGTRSSFPRFEASHALDRIAVAWKVDTGVDPYEDETQWPNTWDLGYAVSENGGHTWARYEYDRDGQRETDPHVLVDTRGALHMAYMVQVPEEAEFEVFYIRSVDGGETWTTPEKVDHEYGRFPQLALDAARDRLWIVHKDDRDQCLGNHRADIGARPLTWDPFEDRWLLGELELLSDHGDKNVMQFGSSLGPDGSLHVVYDVEHADVESISLHASHSFTPIPVIFSIHMEARTARECSSMIDPADCADDSEWLENMDHLDSLIDALNGAGLKGTFMHQIQWLLRLETSATGRMIIYKMIGGGHEIALHHHGWDHADPDGYSDCKEASGVDHLGGMDAYLDLVRDWSQRWGYPLVTMDGTSLETCGDERPEWLYRTGSDRQSDLAFDLMYDPVADECGFADGSGKPAWTVVALPNSAHRDTVQDDHTWLGYTYFGKGSANSQECLSLYTEQILARTRAIQVTGPARDEAINMVLHPVSDWGSDQDLRSVYEQFFHDIADQGGQGMTVRKFMCDRAGFCE